MYRSDRNIDLRCVRLLKLKNLIYANISFHVFSFRVCFNRVLDNTANSVCLTAGGVWTKN